MSKDIEDVVDELMKLLSEEIEIIDVCVGCEDNVDWTLRNDYSVKKIEEFIKRVIDNK